MAEVHELHEGRWRPSVPLPYLFVLRVCCGECHRSFWGPSNTHSRAYRRYEAHYRREHLP
jgi:hypothetical protein